MPARRRCVGEWMAPAERMISRPRNSVGLPVHQRLDPDAAEFLEQELGNLRACRDRQVWPFAHIGVEVADRGGDALLVCVRDGDRKIAVLEESVLIREMLVACALERLGQRLGVPGPMLFRHAPNGNRAVLPMPFVVEIEVALELLEVRKHVLPLPARGPASLPLVIVGRRTSVCHLTIDGGAAAEHARLLILPAGAASARSDRRCARQPRSKPSAPSRGSGC